MKKSESTDVTQALFAERAPEFTDEELVCALEDTAPRKEEDPVERLIREKLEPIGRQLEALEKQYVDSMERLMGKLTETMEAETAEHKKMPDPHITGASAPAPAGDWKSRMKSENPSVRDSVLKDIFGE